jgi:hypothetical protein
MFRGSAINYHPFKERVIHQLADKWGYISNLLSSTLIHSAFRPILLKGDAKVSFHSHLRKG